jgi:hypothetical protein
LNLCVKSAAHGTFTFDAPGMSQRYGGYSSVEQFLLWLLSFLGGSEDTDRFWLGTSGVAAFIRLKECTVGSGG